MMRIITNEGSTTPSVAITAPKSPPWDEPINVARFMAIGHGVDSLTPM